MLSLQWLEHPEPASSEEPASSAESASCAEPASSAEPASGAKSAPTKLRWHTLRVGALPLRRPVVLRLVPAQETVEPQLLCLVDQLRDLLGRMAGEAMPELQPELDDLEEPSPGTWRLEVVLADGCSPVAPQHRWTEALEAGEGAWVLPLLPADQPSEACDTLPPPLRKCNVAFWRDNWRDEGMLTLALTVLARAGVTDLDRRVFISYRRAEAQPMAHQLFAALTRRNVRVFLDTVSVEPAVDFQPRLYEQLADKSMVVVLQSPGFRQSVWTMREVEFAMDHQLSLLIVLWPDLAPEDALRGSRSGDPLRLRADDLSPPTGAGPAALTEEALMSLVNTILTVHDLELVRRLDDMRGRTLAALRRHGLEPTLSTTGVAIHAGGPPPRFSLVPTGRPPGPTDLHDASIRDDGNHGPIRVVVGHTGSMPPERRRLLDWLIDNRNVRYWDVTMLDALIPMLQRERP